MSTNPFHDLAKTWWDTNGPFHTLHDINPLRLSYIEKFVKLQGLHVLDLGCGGGILSEALARTGAVVTGLDIEMALIEVAKQHAIEQKLTIDYRQCAIEEFEHPGFDVIVRACQRS
jgi:2-polyprenyl-6-hydroxyphenyl methylase/3-demethylubiquinone-9 3-methyltransferase